MIVAMLMGLTMVLATAAGRMYIGTMMTTTSVNTLKHGHGSELGHDCIDSGYGYYENYGSEYAFGGYHGALECVRGSNIVSLHSYVIG